MEKVKNFVNQAARRIHLRAVAIIAVLLLLVASVIFAVIGERPASATDTVYNYLSALANGDASKALTYLENVPASGPLLTDAVMKVSSESGSISEIETHDQINLDSTVYATYKVGKELATQVFHMKKTDKGWLIADSLSTLSVPKDLAFSVKLNGVDVKPGDKYQVFPGRYLATTDNKFITLADDSVTVKLMNDSYVMKPSFTLNEAGNKAALAAAEKSLDTCIKAKSATDTKCPNFVSLPNGVTVIDSSVAWTLKNKPFEKVKFEVTPDGVAHGVVNLDLNVKLKYKYGIERSTSQDVTYKNVRCDVKVLANPITVAWPR